MSEALVGVLMGSESDRPQMSGASDVLTELGVAHEVFVMSAHRDPDRVAAYAEGAAARGVKVLIAGAGMAAHLAGTVAARTTLPVIGVPLDGSPLLGLDALLSTVQMPPGVPVATVAVGKAGAKNAGWLAARILALADPALAARLAAARELPVPETAVRAVNLEHPDPQVLAHAARLLHEGEIVAAPSDTVYGLLGLSRSREALAKLTALKGRPGPFIVLVATWEEARSWTRGVEETVWERLAGVWPGPLTALLPTDAGMPGTAEGRVGLRMPRSAFLEALLAAVGEPLFSTSANRRGNPPADTGLEVLVQFPDGLALLLDGGPSPESHPSTVVDLCVDPPRVLRQGLGDAAPLLDPAPPPS